MSNRMSVIAQISKSWI